MLMSAVDLGSGGVLTGSEDEISAALLGQAEIAYSIPESKPAAIDAAAEVSRSLAPLGEQERSELKGPLWRSRRDLDALKATARAVGRDGELVVGADGNLVALVRDR
jgi:hypothetical protein